MSAIWIGFFCFVAILLFLDLFVLNRKDHVPRTSEALKWTAMWTTIGLGFSGFVYLAYGNGWVDSELTANQAVINYLTGYLVELSLSMDNVFVIALIFAYFRVPAMYQHRVLFWGILGAIFFRLIMILAGVYLLDRFDWMFYVFGLLLLYSALKMTKDAEDVPPSENPVIKFIKRVVPVTKHYHGNRFWIKKRGVRAATPLFIALMMVETTDVIFAIDSIPAILGITTDSFLVFSSNILAILGLRSLYFVLSRMLDKFAYVKISLALILAFVGIKMILHEVWHAPDWVSLVVIFGLLAGGIAVSLLRPAPVDAPVDPTENPPRP
ncbi:TerC family protein [Neolewinella lacunae]|uniref:TerC family protein n=1 Tax=Neolewinella lacunae TaxID=1517758 RepID=A0A923PKN9_9BACT|nr:TerC family protein [Neolewinella lacunae]MBC6993049.1 TerC family protein [Neolewinella lacunae]MDN3635871.1 TerC family protein [Neolewinella lacunae]